MKHINEQQIISVVNESLRDSIQCAFYSVPIYIYDYKMNIIMKYRLFIENGNFHKGSLYELLDILELDFVYAMQIQSYEILKIKTGQFYFLN